LKKHWTGFKKRVYLWAVLKETALVVLFWYFRKKYRGFVNQWKASLKWDAFFLLKENIVCVIYWNLEA
jgi:hypothetical protein